MKKTYAKALLSVLAPVLLGGAAMQAQAITISATESRYEPGGIRYYFEVSGWTTSDSGPSPCVSDDPLKAYCNILIAANRGAGRYDPIEYYPAQWRVENRRGDATLGNLLWDLGSKGFQIPLSASILIPTRAVTDDICITFAYSRTGVDIGGVVGLFGPCTRVATPVLQCEIKGDPTINHKNLPDNALEGATASTQLNVMCRGPASVTVSASRTNSYGVRLREDDSLYSKITVNGKDATAGISLPVSNGLASPLSITSTLVTRGTVTPGAFSGSTVVTVSPP